VAATRIALRPELQREIANVRHAYQASRYGLVARRLSARAASFYIGDERTRALSLLGQVYR